MNLILKPRERIRAGAGKYKTLYLKGTDYKSAPARVHLEGLPRGIYIFKAVSGTQVHVARFVRL